jgi:phosphoglycolate phosphatase-like HAD superfamily hydrolase
VTSAAIEDAGERFYRTVLADVNGTATDEEADSLRSDEDTAREWLAVLTRMSQDTDAALTKMRADTLARRQASIAAGPRAKEGFFRWVAERERERAGLVRQKAAIVERIKEARDVIRSVSTRPADSDQLARIETKIDALTDLVRQLLEEP